MPNAVACEAGAMLESDEKLAPSIRDNPAKSKRTAMDNHDRNVRSLEKKVLGGSPALIPGFFLSAASDWQWNCDERRELGFKYFDLQTYRLQVVARVDCPDESGIILQACVTEEDSSFWSCIFLPISGELLEYLVMESWESLLAPESANCTDAISSYVHGRYF
jgi:hypothetical protein